MPTFKRSGIPKKAVKERKADKLARPLLCALRKSKTMPMKAALTAAEKKKGEKRRRLRAILAHYGECLLQFSFTQWFDKHTNFLFFFLLFCVLNSVFSFSFSNNNNKKKTIRAHIFPFFFCRGGVTVNITASSLQLIRVLTTTSLLFSIVGLNRRKRKKKKLKPSSFIIISLSLFFFFVGACVYAQFCI